MPPTTRRPAVVKKKDVSQKPPDSKNISIRWKDDYNILLVNQQVLDHLKGRRAVRQELEGRIEALKKSLKPGIGSDKASGIHASLDEANRELSNMKVVSILDYCGLTDHLIQEYRKLSDTGPLVMGQKMKKNNTVSARKTQLVEAFFAAAVNFCPMDIVRDSKSSGFCSLCNGMIIDNGENYVCMDCNSLQSKMELNEDEGDNEEVNTSKKSGYDSGLNFKDLVLQLQIQYPVNIPPRILESIKGAIFQYQGFTLEKLTRADLVKIMKDLGLGIWYKHLNKIFYMLTGKSSGNYEKYTNNVIRRGELLYEIYREIKPADRSNFIHGLHLYWLFLKNENCDPSMDDFILLKSRQVELANIETLEKGFAILRVRHPEFRWDIYQIP